jgi:hypothetical protein
VNKITQQNPFVLVLAIIGACAIVYLLWLAYQRHVDEQQRALLLGPPTGGAAQLYQPSTKPPPQ